MVVETGQRDGLTRKEVKAWRIDEGRAYRNRRLKRNVVKLDKQDRNM